MLVYGTLLVPTLFVALVGVNLLVWARSRINYVFIFGTSPHPATKTLTRTGTPE